MVFLTGVVAGVFGDILNSRRALRLELLLVRSIVCSIEGWSASFKDSTFDDSLSLRVRKIDRGYDEKDDGAQERETLIGVWMLRLKPTVGRGAGSSLCFACFEKLQCFVPLDVRRQRPV